MGNEESSTGGGGGGGGGGSGGGGYGDGSGGDKVLSDSQVTGGEKLRGIDETLSEKFGGYKSLQNGSQTEPSFYGKYVEPLAHAAEHTRRAVGDGFNGKEWARAKDEVNTFGSGLQTMDDKYQKEYTKQQEEAKRREQAEEIHERFKKHIEELMNTKEA